MGSKSSPSVPVCSHSPDAVPIDSSVHKVFFEYGPPCLCWPTSFPATSTRSPWHSTIGWLSRWHPDYVACHPKPPLCYHVVFLVRSKLLLTCAGCLSQVRGPTGSSQWEYQEHSALPNAGASKQIVRSVVSISHSIKTVWHCKVALQLFDSDTIISATYYYYYYLYSAICRERIRDAYQSSANAH